MTIIERAYLDGFIKAAVEAGDVAASIKNPVMHNPVTQVNTPMHPQPPMPAPSSAHAPLQSGAANINSWTNTFSPKAFANHAILPAEHNPNYGILTKYKNTTPEQASINTINHALRDFQAGGGGSQEEFIRFLGDRYAPTKNATNDPNHLNQNWIPNVTKFWNQYNATNQVR